MSVAFAPTQESSVTPKFFSRYNRLTIAQKLDLIKTAEEGKSQRKLAQEFGISLGSVNKILKQKSEIINLYHSGVKGHHNHHKLDNHHPVKLDSNLTVDSCQDEDLEVSEEMEEFLMKCKSMGVPVNKNMLREKANNLDMTDFKNSVKKRHPKKWLQNNTAAWDFNKEKSREYLSENIPEKVFSNVKLESDVFANVKIEPKYFVKAYQGERLTSEGDEEEKSVSGSEEYNQTSDTNYRTETENCDVDETELNYEQVSQMLLKIRIFSTLNCPQLCNKILELENEFNELSASRQNSEIIDYEDEIC